MLLATEVHAGVATVAIDHPPHQLVDGAFIAALVNLLAEVEPDPDVRVLLFRSADPDFFLMHGDVEQLLAMPRGAYVRQEEPNVAAATFERLAASRLVTIGLIDGAARGGGCEFLSALDIRIGSERTIIGQPEAPMGILPGAGGTARWPRLVGRGRALDILLTGRDVTAHEALSIGWLDRLVPATTLLAEGHRMATRIAAVPAGSLAAVKRVVDLSLTPIDPALTAESDALAERFASDEHESRMRRFLAAGGQTRDGEGHRMDEIIASMLDAPAPDR